MRETGRAPVLPDHDAGRTGRATPEEIRRFASITLIAAAGWGLNALVYLALLRRWHTGLVEVSVIAGTLLLRQWALATSSPRRLRAGNHGGLLLTFLGLVAVALLNGQSGAIAVWYLVALPMVAAYLIGRRAALGWMLVCALSVVGLWASERFVHFMVDYPPLPEHVVFARLIIMACCLAFGLAARDASDRYIRRLQSAWLAAARSRSSSKS